jgi:hypothetical protein
MKVNGRFVGIYLFHLQDQTSMTSNRHILPAACFMLISCLAYNSTFKIEAIYSYETCLDLTRTSRCCI